MFGSLRFRCILAVLCLFLSLDAYAQNVGIGTTAPTQTLDVNGQLRVRGLNGSGNRLPMVMPDGTLGINAPVFSTDPASNGIPLASTGSVATATGPYSVAVSGTTACVVNFSGNTLQVFDVSTPTAPVLRGSIATGANPTCVALSGTTACVTNGNGASFQVFDVSTSTAPVLLSTLAVGGFPYGVATSGTTAYLANFGSSSLQVVDVSVPTAPVLRGAIAVGGGTIAVAVNGTTAYVVNQNDNSFQVIDVSVPSAPVLRSTVPTETRPRGVAVSGTTAYVVNQASNSLQVFDASTPTAPVLRATTATDASPGGVAVNGGTATAYVVCAGSGTLQSFDVSVPTAPVLNATLATTSGPRNVAVSGNTIYVVNTGNNTLQLFPTATPGRTVVVNPDGSFSSAAVRETAAGPGLSSTLAGSTTTLKLGGAALTAAADVPLAGNNLTFSGSGRVGIGTGSPSSTLTANGTVAVGVINNFAGGTSAAPLALSGQVATYLSLRPTTAGANGNGYFQLPAASNCVGRIYYLCNVGTVPATVVSAGGSLVPGATGTAAATYTMPFNSTGRTVIVISDGVNWTIGTIN